MAGKTAKRRKCSKATEVERPIGTDYPVPQGSGSYLRSLHTSWKLMRTKPLESSQRQPLRLNGPQQRYKPLVSHGSQGPVVKVVTPARWRTKSLGSMVTNCGHQRPSSDLAIISTPNLTAFTCASLKFNPNSWCIMWPTNEPHCAIPLPLPGVLPPGLRCLNATFTVCTTRIDRLRGFDSPSAPSVHPRPGKLSSNSR